MRLFWSLSIENISLANLFFSIELWTENTFTWNSLSFGYSVSEWDTRSLEREPDLMLMFQSTFQTEDAFCPDLLWVLTLMLTSSV